jgi:hypothetical protein
VLGHIGRVVCPQAAEDLTPRGLATVGRKQHMERSLRDTSMNIVLNLFSNIRSPRSVENDK